MILVAVVLCGSVGVSWVLFGGLPRAVLSVSLAVSFVLGMTSCAYEIVTEEVDSVAVLCFVSASLALLVATAV